MTRVSLMILLLVSALLLSAPEAWATDEVSSEKVCSYFDVLTQLNISKGNELYTMTRPILDYRNQTIVHLEIALYGILGMDEKEQMFVASLLTSLQWHSDLFSWNPEDFCGINYIPSIPKKLMWEPDIIIEEMIAEDKAPPSPFLTLYSNGTVELNRGMVVVSTCLMQIFSFPFDTQRCTLTFKSITHTDKELRLLAQGSNAATRMTRKVLRTQDEWTFCNVNVTKSSEDSIDHITYTITMRRRPVLYVVNLLLPIWFFMCLDVASLFISEKGGEKLSFKVTVMLSVTVLQLILNDILPSTSSRIPLIATYCAGIFSLMLLSLCETIVVMHLMEKDFHFKVKEEEDCSMDEDKKDLPMVNKGDTDKNGQTRLHISDRPVSTSSLLPAVHEGKPGETELHLVVLGLLTEIRKALETRLEGGQVRDGKPGYWTRIAKRIHVVFIYMYLFSIFSFVCYMATRWYMVIHHDATPASQC
ncbi:unnamed protein product [Boreogadus saida]